MKIVKNLCLFIHFYQEDKKIQDLIFLFKLQNIVENQKKVKIKILNLTILQISFRNLIFKNNKKVQTFYLVLKKLLQKLLVDLYILL